MLNKLRIINRGKNKLFRKLMFYMLLASVLMAVFSSLTFYYFGGRRYSKQVLNEMIPRASSIASIMSDYYDGLITEKSVNRFVFGNSNDGTSVLVFDANGKRYEPSKTHQIPEPSFSDEKEKEDFSDIVTKVLATGESIQRTRFNLVLIAMPVTSSSNAVTGVVIVMKMSADIRSSMRSMMLALFASFVIVSIFMIAFAYYGSKRISDPILKMEAIATAMQHGDFSQRADDSIGNEIGRLGSAFNALSCELSKTISDLEESKTRLNTILNSLSEGVVAFEQNMPVYGNPALFSLLHMDKCPETMETFQQIIPEFDKHYYKALSESSGDYVEFEYNGRVLGCSFMKLESTDINNPGIVMLIRDITEAVRLEQTRRDYVANVSHELKTPITSIRSLAETLNDGLIRDSEEQNRYYGYILRESIRMGHLIEELLELSRIQSGSVAFKKEEFSLNDLMSGIVERMTLIASYSGILLNYQTEEGIVVQSNRSRIDQVCVAILDNAIKYCVDSGEITVSVTKEEHKAVVSIMNDGSIAENDIPHLFDRFYKADKSHRGNGTGLGLAITKEILERLGETIRVSSSDGKVIFTFTVSLAEKQAEISDDKLQPVEPEGLITA